MTLKTGFPLLLCLILLAPISVTAQQNPRFPDEQPDALEDSRSVFESDGTTIQGQVLSDNPSRLNHPIAVQLESLGAVRDTVFTDGNGNFTFDNIQPTGAPYIVIEEPGFKPLRERVELGPASPAASGLSLVYILEYSNVEEDDPPDDPGTVDLARLAVPEEAIEVIQRAASASQNGDFESAAELLEEAIEIAPDFYEAQNALGVEYQKLGRLDEAKNQFDIAMELNPNAAEPVLSLGILYLQDSDIQTASSKPDEALESLEKSYEYLEEALARNAGSALGQYYFGAVLYRTGDSTAARDHLDRALELDDQLYAARLMLFNVDMAERDYTAALNQLTNYLEEYPQSPQRENVERMKADLEGQLSGR